MKSNVHTETCTPICITALFIIVKIWKLPWYFETMEYYAALNRNGLPSHEDMDEPCIIPSESS